MFGHGSSSRVRMKPPASKWLLAPSPVPLSIHSRPIFGWFHHLSAGYSDTGSLHSNWMYISR
ncbi:Uncharacterised protein [Burkholderia pseudomallei]|nr:Uncharacterised protein [Burkholderia pseudomallei]VBE08293.1 Uncharacterised protein [Burkholderia pseudomallei]